MTWMPCSACEAGCMAGPPSPRLQPRARLRTHPMETHAHPSPTADGRGAWCRLSSFAG